MRKIRQSLLPVLLLLLLLLLGSLGIVSTAIAAEGDSLPGAIWTTDPTGRDVNQNVFYTDKTQVYLTGGPDKKFGTQLPEGDYYIKVTAPDGTLLGTTVGAKDRPQTYHIDNVGNFVYNPLLSQYMRIDTSRMINASGQFETPALIQLFAATKFKNTNNSGGEYKVWISQLPDFSSKKSDNFKVKVQQPPTLYIEKYNDINKNKQKDPNEEFKHWGVTIKNLTTGDIWHQELDGYGTGVDGTWKGLVEPGEYLITEDSLSGWVPTTSPVVTTPYLTSKVSGSVSFGNRQLAQLKIDKFKDLNANGIFDGEDTWMEWTGRITGETKWGDAIDNPITMPYQEYIEPGTYTIIEDTRSGWENTTPTSETIALVEGSKSQVIFGNIPLANLSITKYNDANRNLIKDANENEVSGWKSFISGTDLKGRPVNKEIELPWTGELFPGSYTVTEGSEKGWVNTTPTSETIILEADDSKMLDFGNRKLRPLDIIKFYDTDMDGVRDDNEDLIPWRVHINGSSIWGEVLDKDIDLSNEGWHDYLDPGTYTITEYLPSNKWFATTATSQTIELTPDPSADIALLPALDVNFGNLYMDTGGGHTHGFWGNPNGEALFNSDPKYLSAINSLTLANRTGDTVTPFSNYSAYKNWNNDAYATNMAYMLSCQLAAMKLNVTAGPEIGFVNENSIIWIGDITPIFINGVNVNKNGFITVKDLISAANEALQQDQLTLSDDINRQYQTVLEKALDKANQDNAAIYVWLTAPSGPYFN